MSRSTARKRHPARKRARTFDARPDTLDFRDRMFVATLVEVPVERPLALYKRTRVPILDQGGQVGEQLRFPDVGPDDRPGRVE